MSTVFMVLPLGISTCVDRSRIGARGVWLSGDARMLLFHVQVGKVRLLRRKSISPETGSTLSAEPEQAGFARAEMAARSPVSRHRIAIMHS
jgi:hypothetical protein